jgi:hypothetical protein
MSETTFVKHHFANNIQIRKVIFKFTSSDDYEVFFARSITAVNVVDKRDELQTESGNQFFWQHDP